VSESEGFSVCDGLSVRVRRAVYSGFRIVLRQFFLHIERDTYAKWDLPLGVKPCVSFWKDVQKGRTARGSESVLAEGLRHT